MRIGSRVAWLSIVCAGAGAILGACEGNTITADPTGTGGSGAGGGGGGSGGATVTTTTTTTSNTSSTSTGPMSTCEQACQHAEECGLPVCDFAGIDCTNPQYDCPAQCLLDATCEQIATLPSGNVDPLLQACFFACQGGGGGGGPGEDCTMCALQSCGGEFQNCNDQECQDWANCAQGCSDSQCLADCNAQYPGAEPYYDAIYGCLCTNCDMGCAALDPCGFTGGGGGGGGAGAGGGGGAGGN